MGEPTNQSKPSKRKPRETYKPKVLPRDDPRRADPVAEAMKYMQESIGVPSLRLCEAMSRIVARGSSEKSRKRFDKKLQTEVTMLSFSEIRQEADAHDADIMSFGEEFSRGLNRVIKRADEMDESAIELLYWIAGTTIRSLEQLFARMPEFIGDFAAKKTTWPTMASPFGSQAKTVFKQLSDMGVGTHSGSPFAPLALERKLRAKGGDNGPTKSTLQDTADEIVIEVVGVIEHLRKLIRAAQRIEILDPESEISKRDWRSNFSPTVSKRLSWEHFESLPDLDQSEEAQKQWYAMLKVFVEDNMMGKPAWEPKLRELGRSGGQKGSTKDLRGQRKRSAAKNPVWDRLRLTLKAIARPVDPRSLPSAESENPL